MHSVVDWFAFAVWEAGELRRSLSVSPDSGVIEDIGAQMLFEEPFWAGRKPISDDPEEAAQYPLPFHPLDLGEAALRELFDFQIEGEADAGRVQPEAIPLVGFRRRNPWWRFW